MAGKNPFLKRANEQHEYTYEQVQELERCMNDSVYFIKNYCSRKARRVRKLMVSRMEGSLW